MAAPCYMIAGQLLWAVMSLPSSFVVKHPVLYLKITNIRAQRNVRSQLPPSFPFTMEENRSILDPKIKTREKETGNSGRIMRISAPHLLFTIFQISHCAILLVHNIVTVHFFGHYLIPNTAKDYLSFQLSFFFFFGGTGV
jgi:hypothetical protein